MIRSVILIYIGFLINVLLVGGLEWAGYEPYFFSVNALIAGIAVGILSCAGITICYSIHKDIHNDQ